MAERQPVSQRHAEIAETIAEHVEDRLSGLAGGRGRVVENPESNAGKAAKVEALPQLRQHTVDPVRRFADLLDEQYLAFDIVQGEFSPGNGRKQREVAAD